VVQPRFCRVIYYFNTPVLGRRHQSFGCVSYEPPARDMVLMEVTQVTAIQEWIQRRINIDQLIKGLLEGERNKMKQIAYKKHSERKFLVGELGFLKNTTLQAG